MSAQLKRFLPIIAGGMLLAFGGAAAACDKGCKPPPPPPVHKPCCKPPKPPAPPVNNVKVNVNVHANATAIAVSNANASSSSSSSGDVFFGGGGANIIATPGFPVIQKLNVVGDTIRKAITEKRTVVKQVIVQAICIDTRGRPHPASQLRPDQEIGEHFTGELYRCIAGTKLQATLAKYEGKIAFDGGETLACGKGEALWHEGGVISCRPATPQRNCFERSLLRRFGVGVKIFKMTKVEEFTSFQEEVQTASHEIALDGGVGGFVH